MDAARKRDHLIISSGISTHITIHLFVKSLSLELVIYFHCHHALVSSSISEILFQINIRVHVNSCIDLSAHILFGSSAAMACFDKCNEPAYKYVVEAHVEDGKDLTEDELLISCLYYKDYKSDQARETEQS